METAVKLAREVRASGVRVTLVVHEHKRLGRGIDLTTLAEELKAAGVGLEFLTGELQGSHDPSGVVFHRAGGPVRDGTRVHPRPQPGRP
ncbi:MAG: recombinase family protein [Streptosporangiaceae bacterium]